MKKLSTYIKAMKMALTSPSRVVSDRAELEEVKKVMLNDAITKYMHTSASDRGGYVTGSCFKDFTWEEITDELQRRYIAG